MLISSILCQYIYLIHRNAFTIAFIIIVKDICAKKQKCHKSNVDKMTDPAAKNVCSFAHHLSQLKFMCKSKYQPAPHPN